MLSYQQRSAVILSTVTVLKHVEICKQNLINLDLSFSEVPKMGGGGHTVLDRQI